MSTLPPSHSTGGARRHDGPHPTCLFPDEPEIARLVLGSKRAKAWPGLAVVLERRGLPRIDPQFGGRYWPKVRAFLDRMQDAGDDSPVPVEHRGGRTGGVRPRLAG